MRTATFILKDNEKFNDLVIYNEMQDEKDIEAAIERAKARDEWEFEDLLVELDKLGSYTIAPLDNIETFTY